MNWAITLAGIPLITKLMTSQTTPVAIGAIRHLVGELPIRQSRAYNMCCTQLSGVQRMPRLDIRLDHDCRARLDAVAKDAGLSVSETVRNMIDQAYEDVLRKERQSAFERLVSLQVETPPDPAELSRELEEAHAPGDLY